LTPDDFRRLALQLPEAVEEKHMEHPDFRVRGKVFATLGWPDATWGVIKLPLEEQEIRTRAEPTVFEPVPGAYGRRGYTKVRLSTADQQILQGALRAAWRAIAPKHLIAEHD
jgi:hypothetical protein